MFFELSLAAVGLYLLSRRNTVTMPSPQGPIMDGNGSPAPHTWSLLPGNEAPPGLVATRLPTRTPFRVMQDIGSDAQDRKRQTDRALAIVWRDTIGTTATGQAASDVMGQAVQTAHDTARQTSTQAKAVAHAVDQKTAEQIRRLGPR
jgi:hypothetical protein